MRHLVYSVRYSVVPINSSPLTITLLCSVITTLVITTQNIQPLSWRYNRVRLSSSDVGAFIFTSSSHLDSLFHAYKKATDPWCKTFVGSVLSYEFQACTLTQSGKRKCLCKVCCLQTENKSKVTVLRSCDCVTLCRDIVSTFHGDPPDDTLHPWSTSSWTVPFFPFLPYLSLLVCNQSLPG
jgi:hypothetical protein